MKTLCKVNDNLVVASYVPDDYTDRMGGRTDLNIPDSINIGVYRYYGLFIERDENVGFVYFHIPDNGEVMTIPKMEVDVDYRDKGFGSILLRVALEDVTLDFSHIKSVNVCSTIEAIPFYERNDFIPFFGDNNLVRMLHN